MINAPEEKNVKLSALAAVLPGVVPGEPAGKNG